MLIKLTLSRVFSKLIGHPSSLDVQLLCLKLETKKFLFNYSYLFWGLLFMGTQCTVVIL